MFYETQEIDIKMLGLTEDKKTKKNKFKALVLQANWLNQNGRYYPSEVIEAATKRLQKSIEAKKVYGSSSHSGTEVHDISHRVLGLEFNKETNELWMQGEILNTRRGLDLKTILKAGGSLGLSICASGKTEKKEIVINGKKAEVDFVKPGLEIQKIDFSTAPAFPNSRMDAGSMFESEDFSIPEKVENEEMTIQEKREDYKKSFKKIFEQKKDTGEIELEETFESWLEDAGLDDDEIDKLIEHDRKTLGLSDLQLFEEAVDSGFAGNFESFKEAMKNEKD